MTHALLYMTELKLLLAPLDGAEELEDGTWWPWRAVLAPVQVPHQVLDGAEARESERAEGFALEIEPRPHRRHPLSARFQP